MSDTDLCTCGGDCPVGDCESYPDLTTPPPGELTDGSGWDDEPCHHDCDENCYDEWGSYNSYCTHQHCGNCGGCDCAGYCDDHQTYNVRPPAETGGVA